MLISLLAFAAAAATAAADSSVFPVYNHDRVAGSMIVARHGDSVTVRWVFTDRNRGARLEVRYLMHGDSVIWTERRPVLPSGQVGDLTGRLEFVGDSVRRTSGTQTSTEKLSSSTYYSLLYTPFEEARAAMYLLRQPRHTGRVAGDDSVRLEIVKELTVSTRQGKERVRLAAVWPTPGSSPSLTWLDSHDNLFATQAGWFMTVKDGAEPALPTLRKIETEFYDAQAERLNARLVKPTSGTIAIRNGDLFDSERGVMRPRTTVVIRGERIVAVGPADSVEIPGGATVIDATGKTVMPGLWDMHGHMQLFSETSGGVRQLSLGITTVRDLASDLDVAVSERDRAQAGRIPGPRAILAGFMEGPGAWAGPTSVIVRTEAEARAWVAKYDSMGYKQVKLYNLIHPDLVPTIAAEAHKRGMRVSGHIPRGLSVPAAVTLGFDEVNHAAFLFSTFYQDSLYVPTMRAYSLVATTVAPNINVDGAPMTDLIAFLKEHKTVIDGTFSVWVESAGTGIAQAVGAGAANDTQRADANYLRLIRRLYDSGVTMVPGTDAFGSSSYNAELEVYERAGVPAPFVLQMATITSARVMKDDRDFGSVAPGKVADVIIVNGRPADHVNELRKVEQVIRGGRLFDASDLKKSAGPE